MGGGIRIRCAGDHVQTCGGLGHAVQIQRNRGVHRSLRRHAQCVRDQIRARLLKRDRAAGDGKSTGISAAVITGRRDGNERAGAGVQRRAGRKDAVDRAAAVIAVATGAPAVVTAIGSVPAILRGHACVTTTTIAAVRIGAGTGIEGIIQTTGAHGDAVQSAI